MPWRVAPTANASIAPTAKAIPSVERPSSRYQAAAKSNDANGAAMPMAAAGASTKKTINASPTSHGMATPAHGFDPVCTVRMSCPKYPTKSTTLRPIKVRNSTRDEVTDGRRYPLTTDQNDRDGSSFVIVSSDRRSKHPVDLHGEGLNGLIVQPRFAFSK